ncbi:MAG: hypothetical protein FWD06_10310 [Oscillospiraceae bacterium]|nr:hypothetical protein [Oscillospiraceae bacterium]
MYVDYGDDNQAQGFSAQSSNNAGRHQVQSITQTHGGNITSQMTFAHTSNGDVEYVTDEKTGMVTSFIYDRFGNVTSRTIRNGDLSLTESMVYTPCGNFLLEHTDFNDNTSYFAWDTVLIGGREVVSRGLLLSATDPNGNTITYTYCPTTDQLLSVSGTGRPGQVVTTSFDVQDQLATITRSHRGGTYSYRYDSRGRTTHAMVGNVALVTNTYNDQNDQLVQQLFANGDRFEPVFDNRGRLVAEYWNGVRAVTYYYNENDRLSQLIDHTGDEDVTQRFDYDFAGRLVRVSGTDGLTTHITYDANGAPTLLRTELNGEVIHDSLFLTNMQGQPMDASFFALGASLSYTYDGLNRPIQRSLMMPNAAVSTSLIFQQDEETGATRNLVETFRNELFGGMLLHEWTYKYDAAGNITRITDHNNRVTEFTFDGLNRLTSETIDGILWEYEFDAGGNITEIRRGGVVEHTLSFGNPNWPDQLTAFDGRTITYDRIGNPLTYGNYSFTWERGRLLTRVYYNGELLHRFGYDAAGRRVSRTSYDGPEPVTTRFYYMGQQLIRQCDGTDTLDFTWDADGRPVGFTHNGTPYFYLLNLLGDVVAIMDADGNIVAEYTYDAWGNVTVFEGRQPVNAPAPTQQSAPAQQHASVAPAASVEAMLNTTAARTPVAVAALAADEPCELFVFAERAFLRMMLAELGLDEESKQALVPAMQTLGLGDRAAVLRAFAAQGVCESYLDMVFLLIENQIWRVELLVEQIFISLFLSETTLDDLGLGVFEPFFAYYAQVFAGLVELLGAYIGIENPDAEILMEFLPFLTAMFEVAFELLTEEMQVDIRAYARAPMLVHQALMAAGEPESAQLDQFLFNMLGLNNPEVAVNRLTCCCLDLGLTREAATAQIAAWRWGENTNHLADYLASRLQVCAYCCFDADWLNTVVGTVISVLYTNFAQLLQDWFNRFNVSRATCELFAFAERLLLRTLIAEVLYVEEADKQVIVSRMQELGLADRAALLRYYQAHGVCESFLDVLFELFDMGWTAELLIEQIFIPVFLSELELNEQSAGVFLPFFAYYAQVFSGLVQLFWEYFDFASLGISMPLFLQLFTPFLAATFELAFELLTEEAHAQIQAYARGPMLVHRALMAAGVPESAELDSVIAQLAFANIITPENLHWFLTCCCQSALDDAAAIAQIATWIAGDNTTYLADYLDWAIDNAFLGWDLPDDLIDLIEQIYYANFAQFLQDWFGVFEWDMSCSWCGDSGELCARCNPSGCPIDPGAPCVCPDCALCDDSGAYCAACNPSDCPVDPGAPCVCPDCALCGDSGELCSQCNPGCPNDCDCPECYVPLQVLGIGHLNPIRYRGKFYCDSMGWYWLQTRFYNPQWRRFINADTFFIAGEDGLSAITAANMFAYANGNPVMMIDPDGRSAVDGVNVDYEHPFLVALEIIVGFIVGVIIWIKAAPAAFTITVVVLISILLVAALLPHVFQFFSDVMAFLGNILTEWEEVGLLDWLRSLGNGSNLFEVEGYGYFLTGSESANASLQQLQSIDVAPLDIDRSRHRTNIRYAHLFYNATHEVFESVDLRVVTTRGNNVEWFYGSSINIGNNQTPDYTGREITVTASDGVSVRNLTAIVRNTFGNSSGILIGSTLPVAIVTAEKENRMMDSITAGGFNEFILYTRDAHLGPLPQNYNSTNASLFLENGSLVHLLGYYGDFYLVQAGGRVLFWNAQQHMRMSPQGFALLARMEAPSPAPDQHTTHPANLTLYRTNASGRITYVRNHRNPGENIATVTVGYGLYVDPRITEGQRLRDYLRNTYGIDTTTLNYWTRGPVAVSLLHNLAGTVRTPGTQVIDHSERTWEVAGWIGRTRLTQWEFDALSYVVIVGRNSARAEILFGSVTSSDSDNAVARVIHNASTGGNITRWESAVAVIRRGDYSGSPRGAFDPLNVA